MGSSQRVTHWIRATEPSHGDWVAGAGAQYQAGWRWWPREEARITFLGASDPARR